MTGQSATAGDRSPARSAGTPRGTAVQRLRARTVAALAWSVGHMPEGPLLRFADLAGDVAFRRGGIRREQATRNLRRVAMWASEQAVGSTELRVAARDRAALDRFVRSAFRQHARYWIELLRAPHLSAEYIRERVDMTQAGPLFDALAPGGAVVFVGLHMGAIELPGFYLGRVAGRSSVGPMEQVADPELRRWFMETRATMGMRLVGLREARRELVRALRDGEAVGLVADRDLTGGGIPTALFGHEAPLPVGPALVVLQADTPIYAVVVRRTGYGTYAARVESVPQPPPGGRRTRVEALLQAEARVFERFILDAPDQWWAVFYPIWPDLVVGARRPSDAPAGDAAAQGPATAVDPGTDA